MKKLFFFIVLISGLAVAKAQTVTINNTTTCTLKIYHSNFNGVCAPCSPTCINCCGTPVLYTVPPGTMVVPALGGIEAFSIFDPCGGSGNTTVGTAPCHSQAAVPYPVTYPCCSATGPAGATWTPAALPATGGTLNIF